MGAVSCVGSIIGRSQGLFLCFACFWARMCVFFVAYIYKGVNLIVINGA